MSDVDLQQLAVDRGGSDGQVHSGGSRLSRYVLPAALLTGFLALAAWASRDLMFPPRQVTVIPVLATQDAAQQAGTPLFQAAGWIEPRPTPVRVPALAPGVVQRLLVVEDQAVEAGQAVAEMVPDDARLALQRAKADRDLRQAEWDEAQATLDAAKTRLQQPVHLQAELGQAQAALASLETQLNSLPFQIQEAEARMQFARQDHQGNLLAKGVVPRRDIDQSQSELAAAQALLEQLRDRQQSLQDERAALTERRDALRTRLQLLADETEARQGAAAGVKAAAARLELARVAVDEAQLWLDRMTVRAPVDGRVYKLIAHPGARIGSGMTQMDGYDGSTVVTLYRPQSMQVRVDARFEDLPKISPGQPVEIKNPAMDTLTGQVLIISGLADIQKNTLEIKVSIEDPPPVCKPEMLVDVTFLAPPSEAESDDAARADPMRLYVPQALVQQGDGGSFVWLADQSAGRARRAPVSTGEAAANGLVEVTSGLDISSRIIVTGAEQLQDGDRIKVVGEEPDMGNTKSEIRNPK